MPANKELQLRDKHGCLFICRGCDLSGELYVAHHGDFCELCDPEPLTAAIIEDMGSLLPETKLNAQNKEGPVNE